MTTMTANTRLMLGHSTPHSDGTWFAVAVWDAKARRFVDAPTLGLHIDEYLARKARATMMAGTTRTVRYTVWQGAVTTRTELRT